MWRSCMMSIVLHNHRQTGNFFDLTNSQTVSEQVNEDLLAQVETFLLKSNFMKPDKEILSHALELSKELINQQMFFFAGVLLFNVISKFSLKEII